MDEQDKLGETEYFHGGMAPFLLCERPFPAPEAAGHPVRGGACCRLCLGRKGFLPNIIGINNTGKLSPCVPLRLPSEFRGGWDVAPISTRPRTLNRLGTNDGKLHEPNPCLRSLS
jgi:hypothetical protein